ncbi:MAG: hypothetical protein HYX55_06695 [Chloroflexi bacterium]|nr:hypothetical protein [Chloroflexota bacterium]
MTSLRAAMRPMRTELLGVAGVTALLLLAAAGVAVRLLAFDLPIACLDTESTSAICFGRQFDAQAYASFASKWSGLVGIFAIALPAVAGLILGIVAIAKELDQRTAVLAWSVDVSRRHWLAQRTLPLLAVIVVLGVVSAEVMKAMLGLQAPGIDLSQPIGFEALPYSGFGPMAAGMSAFGIAMVVGAVLGRLLPALLAAAALVVIANLLVSQGNERLMAGESLVAEYASVGAGRAIDFMLRTPDGRIVSWDEGFAEFGDPMTGELDPAVVQMARYVPIEIYPQVAARYALFHLLLGMAALTFAFAVVERRSP